MLGLMAVILLAGVVLACRPGMDKWKLLGLVFLLVCIVWCLVVMVGHLSV